jgi:hypothetical protein
MGVRNRRKIIIAWYYAGDPQQPLLFPWQGDDHAWGVDYDVNKAATFETLEEAAAWWLGKHTFPDDYKPYLHDGSILFFEATRSGLMGVLPLL